MGLFSWVPVVGDTLDDIGNAVLGAGEDLLGTGLKVGKDILKTTTGINLEGFKEDLEDFWKDPGGELYEIGSGDYGRREAKKRLEAVTLPPGMTFEDYKAWWKGKQPTVETWQQYANQFTGGDLDKALEYQTNLEGLGDGYAVSFADGVSVSSKDVKAHVDTYKKRFKAREGTLGIIESAAGISTEGVPKELKNSSQAADWYIKSKDRYERATRKVLGDEIFNLDEGGFKKLEDFSRKDYGKGGEAKPIQAGLNKIRDRLSGDTDRDTGKNARQVLASGIKESKASLPASQMSSMERLADTSAARNVRQQAISQYTDKVKAREELAAMASRVMKYDYDRKDDLRKTRGAYGAAVAGMEAGNVGFEELWGLNNSPLKY